MNAGEQPLLLPDSGPLITLAYAGQLDLLLRSNWSLWLVDAVVHEVTRNVTPTRAAISDFIARHHIPTIETMTFRHYRERMAAASSEGQMPRKAGLGELALQEAINQLALLEPPQPAVLLFEDYEIASETFYLPEGTVRVSTRAFLEIMEENGWLDSAANVELAAIQAGRQFSRLRFPWCGSGQRLNPFNHRPFFPLHEIKPHFLPRCHIRARFRVF
ncbi:hypothetical protein AGMMS50289_22780 [Betaproteobacteria bacterium]|nr:hypothetical protein AGMMS50289_22780 [Betaproteobacteria bacterium]